MQCHVQLVRRSKGDLEAICKDCPCDLISARRMIEMERSRRRQLFRAQRQAEIEMQ